MPFDPAGQWQGLRLAGAELQWTGVVAGCGPPVVAAERFLVVRLQTRIARVTNPLWQRCQGGCQIVGVEPAQRAGLHLVAVELRHTVTQGTQVSQASQRDDGVVVAWRLDGCKLSGPRCVKSLTKCDEAAALEFRQCLCGASDVPEH